MTTSVKPLEYDPEILAIAEYAARPFTPSAEALLMVRHCLFDSLACSCLATTIPDCAALLGPIVPNTVVPNGARIWTTSHVVDPIQAAFAMGTLIRWLDYNDTWLAAEWGHPSDNFGALLAVGDYVSQCRVARGLPAFTMEELLVRAVKAYELQGILALKNSFNMVGVDHVILVKLASTAIATEMLGGSEAEIAAAVSQIWLDGNALRTYRHFPNTGARKSWAAGDATSRAVRLSMMTLAGQRGYPQVLSTPRWGFNAAVRHGQSLVLEQAFGSYVAEHILLKISYPAEFHSQTAIECAEILHPVVKERLNEISRIVITTQEPAVRIIAKTGPLRNPADRDHCLQYVVAVMLISGTLTEHQYENDYAANPAIDSLRDKMEVIEDKSFTDGYYDPAQRSIANSVQVFFDDGSKTEKIEIHFPLGSKRRRTEGMPALERKVSTALEKIYSPSRTKQLLEWWAAPEVFNNIAIQDFMSATSIE